MSFDAMQVDRSLREVGQEVALGQGSLMQLGHAFASAWDFKPFRDLEVHDIISKLTSPLDSSAKVSRLCAQVRGLRQFAEQLCLSRHQSLRVRRGWTEPYETARDLELKLLDMLQQSQARAV